VTRQERRDAVVAALAAGRVPRENPTKLWAGNGTGSHCAICGAILTPTDVEYEVEFASGQELIVDRHCHEL